MGRQNEFGLITFSVQNSKRNKSRTQLRGFTLLDTLRP